MREVISGLMSLRRRWGRGAQSTWGRSPVSAAAEEAALRVGAPGEGRKGGQQARWEALPEGRRWEWWGWWPRFRGAGTWWLVAGPPPALGPEVGCL